MANTMRNRLRPFDLLSYKTENGDMLLTEAITAMQEGKIYPCPKCLADPEQVLNPEPTGLIPIPGIADEEAVCDVCLGFMATDVEYRADPDNPGSYIVYQEEVPS